MNVFEPSLSMGGKKGARLCRPFGERSSWRVPLAHGQVSSKEPHPGTKGPLAGCSPEPPSRDPTPPGPSTAESPPGIATNQLEHAKTSPKSPSMFTLLKRNPPTVERKERKGKSAYGRLGKNEGTHPKTQSSALGWASLKGLNTLQALKERISKR